MSKAPRQVVEVAGDSSDPRGLVAVVRRYVGALRGRGRSPWTVNHQVILLNRFILWAEEREIHRPGDVTRQVVEQYQRHLARATGRGGRPLAVSYQSQHLFAVRGLFKWMAREGIVLSDPAAHLELPRQGRRLPRDVLSVAEAEQVLNSVEPSTPARLRDRAMMEVLYSTGIRRAELLGLKVGDLDLEGGLVWVRDGKGGKDRVVPLGRRAAAWTERYLVEVRPTLVNGHDDGTVFLAKGGKGFSLDGFTHKVRDYVRASGVPKRGSVHLFRHTMATAMLENGADVRHVQAMLGHERLSTTQVYTHVSIRKLKEVHERTHPGRAERRDPAESREDTA